MSCHYNDVIMSAMASQITGLMIVYSAVYSGADQSEHQSSASLAYVRGIHRWPVNSPHKGPVTRKMFPFDDVIMYFENAWDKTVVCFSSVKAELHDLPRVTMSANSCILIIYRWGNCITIVQWPLLVSIPHTHRHYLDSMVTYGT